MTRVELIAALQSTTMNTEVVLLRRSGKTEVYDVISVVSITPECIVLGNHEPKEDHTTLYSEE